MHSARGIVRWRTGRDRAINDHVIGRHSGENRQKCTFGGPRPRTVPSSENCPILSLTPWARGIVRQWYDNDRTVTEVGRGRQSAKNQQNVHLGGPNPKRHDLAKTHGYGH